MKFKKDKIFSIIKEGVITLRVIVKFGGTSIQNAERVEKAAQSIIKKVREGSEVIVVVSAMGSTTDELISLLNAVTNSSYNRQDYNEYISFGERMSARLIASTLKAKGLKTRFFDPFNYDFPIITDSENLNEANILWDKSKEQCKKYIEPLLKEKAIPVVCGFFSRSVADGNIACLGRGGSDVTAFALGNFLKADEVIIVTDTEGIASADPRLVKGVRILPQISIEEMKVLAENGAKVLHPRALNFKDEKIKAKIINFKNCDLNSQGTEIVGNFANGNSVTIFPEKLSLLTVVGEKILETPGLLKDIITPLSKSNISIQGVGTGKSFIGIYLFERSAEKAYDLVHPVILQNNFLKSVSLKKNIALLTLSNRDFIETPGIIEKITRPLAENNINILEMSTMNTDILLFVDWSYKDIAYKLINNFFMKMNGIIESN